MQQIADWLKTLGLSEHTQRFAENDIDFTILGDLTDQDLEKIGITSLGPSISEESPIRACVISARHIIRIAPFIHS
jgi:SAM domain (Sterile alpha motif)